MTSTVSDDLREIVGATVGACVVFIIGVVFAVFLIRCKNFEKKSKDDEEKITFL